MPRQYVFSNVMKLRELRQARSKVLLAREVVRMSKQINQRFYRLEKAGLNVDSYAYQLASMQLGKERPRYTTSFNKLSNLPFDTLYKQALEINEKIASGTSAIRGVKATQEKRITNSLAELKARGYDIDRDDFEEFLRIGGSQLIKEFGSEQIFEDFWSKTQEGVVTVKEFVREFKRYKSLERVDYSKVLRNLKRINKKRLDRLKEKENE